MYLIACFHVNLHWCLLRCSFPSMYKRVFPWMYKKCILVWFDEYWTGIKSTQIPKISFWQKTEANTCTVCQNIIHEALYLKEMKAFISPTVKQNWLLSFILFFKFINAKAYHWVDMSVDLLLSKSQVANSTKNSFQSAQ